MAFDGITIANIVQELNEKLTDGRISKIAQPEHDELQLIIKSSVGQQTLMISASASLPLIYLTTKKKQSPMTAPNFCMLLRKHIGNGRIVSITQPGLERVIQFEIEHRDELGDLCRKLLIVEIMGKHSNIIFCNSDHMILDSIKHVSAQMSSIREVLPGREYFIPETQHKENPLDITDITFYEHIFTKPMPLDKAIYTSLTGISPLIAQEICYQALLDADRPANTLETNEKLHLYHTFTRLMEDIRQGHFEPQIIFKGPEPVEFAAVPITRYAETEHDNIHRQHYDSISELLETYYARKHAFTRMRQKSSDLRRVVQTALERNRKKYDLQTRQLRDTEKREKYKVYGELLNTYGYNLEPGKKSITVLNYYTNEDITIPINPDLSGPENAKKYFARYNKLKRTYEALTSLIEETAAEIAHLESVSTALDIAGSEDDLLQIREELITAGHVKRKYTKGKVKLKSQPFHYRSSDGYDIYVGKNNLQNDELTFRFATGGDWWFHAKQMPGSHVIVKSQGTEMPDRVFEEAGRLAAYYSKGRGAEKVEIDYVEKKHVKKPAGGKPGFVVYYTNYSLIIDSDISALTLISD